MWAHGYIFVAIRSRLGYPHRGQAGQGPTKGRTKIHPSGNYVQVRYPLDRRWVTVAVSDTRRVAARIGADAYRNLENERGHIPTQVRIVSAAQLRREHGHQAVQAADTDIARGAEDHRAQPARRAV
jgi:hypothetical protein